MRITRGVCVLAAVAVATLLWSGTVVGQGKAPDCEKAKAPEKIEGQVVKVDMERGKITVRGTDGTTHEFDASKETLQDYKVGDRIQAKLRSAPKC
jgi:hypothetical protein